MRKLYVAATEASRSAFECEREVIDFDNANFTQVSIAVMTADEALAGKLEQIESNAFGIPVVILNEGGKVDPCLIGRAASIIDRKSDDASSMAVRLTPLRRSMRTPSSRRSSAASKNMLATAMPSLTARDIRAAPSFAVILPAANLLNSSAKTSSAPTCATPTFRWAIC